MVADMKDILERVSPMVKENLPEIRWWLKANGEMENYYDFKKINLLWKINMILCIK